MQSFRPATARPSPSPRVVTASATRRDVLNATALATAASCLTAMPGQHAQAAYVDEEVAQTVFNSASASVVAIEDFVSGPGGLVSEGVGSGFVWDTYGHVVTNYHCISKLARDQTGSQVRNSVGAG